MAYKHCATLAGVGVIALRALGANMYAEAAPAAHTRVQLFSEASTQQG